MDSSNENNIPDEEVYVVECNSIEEMLIANYQLNYIDIDEDNIIGGDYDFPFGIGFYLHSVRRKASPFFNIIDKSRTYDKDSYTFITYNKWMLNGYRSPFVSREDELNVYDLFGMEKQDE